MSAPTPSVIHLPRPEPWFPGLWVPSMADEGYSLWGMGLDFITLECFELRQFQPKEAEEPKGSGYFEDADEPWNGRIRWFGVQVIEAAPPAAVRRGQAAVFYALDQPEWSGVWMRRFQDMWMRGWYELPNSSPGGGGPTLRHVSADADQRSDGGNTLSRKTASLSGRGQGAGDGAPARPGRGEGVVASVDVACDGGLLPGQGAG